MKSKRSMDVPIIDKYYLQELYKGIQQKMLALDQLNQNFKTRQQQHFIKSFMNVVEKMGNDLILAQQAYRNINIEVKRDQYCMELATELQFFRTSCFQLKAALEKSQKSLAVLRIQNQNLETEINSLHFNLEKKVAENLHLKAANKQLSNKIRQISIHNKIGRVNRSVDLRNSSKIGEGQFQNTPNRFLATQGSRRESYTQSKNRKDIDERITDANTPNNDLFVRIEGIAGTSSSFRRRPLHNVNNPIINDVFK